MASLEYEIGNRQLNLAAEFKRVSREKGGN